jgi:hypothetical protein
MSAGRRGIRILFVRHTHRWQLNVNLDLREKYVELQTGFIWLKVIGFCQHGNELLGFHKSGRVFG